jgi:hypothetical protein
MNTGVFLVIVAVGLSALVQIFTDPRITREFVAKSLVALAIYAAHVALGIGVVLYLASLGPKAAVGAAIAAFGWIGLGGLGLVRFAPRLKEPPRVLMQFGIPDLICLAMIAGGIGAAIGLI